jgi:tetratricopeptide (TPR) repeat protein
MRKNFISSILFIFLLSNFIFSESKSVTEYFKEGNSYFQQKNYDEAIKSYKNALAISPDTPEIVYNIGVAYLFKGNNYYEIAKNWFKKSIELNPKLSSAYYNLGYISLKQKNYEEAISYLKKAKELNPKDEEIQIALRKAENFKKESELEKKVEIEFKKENVSSEEEKSKKIIKVTPVLKKEIVKIEKKQEEKTKKENLSPFIRKIIFCKDIKNKIPQEITKKFSTSDEKVVVFIEIYKLSGNHKFRIEWYTPAGKLYTSYPHDISPAGERYRTWYYCKINGAKAANFRGKWKIKIYLDGDFVKEENFWIE